MTSRTDQMVETRYWLRFGLERSSRRMASRPGKEITRLRLLDNRQFTTRSRLDEIEKSVNGSKIRVRRCWMGLGSPRQAMKPTMEETRTKQGRWALKCHPNAWQADMWSRASSPSNMMRACDPPRTHAHTASGSRQGPETASQLKRSNVMPCFKMRTHNPESRIPYLDTTFESTKAALGLMPCRVPG